MAGPSKEQLQACFDGWAVDYEKQTGYTSRKLTEKLLDSPLLLPFTSESVIHENACGTGVITEEIIKRWPAGKPRPIILATDFSPAFLKGVRDMVKKKTGWEDSVTVEEMDMNDLSGIPDNTLTHSFTCLSIFICPDSVREIYRTLKPGGMAVVDTWKEHIYRDIIQRAMKIGRPDLPLWEMHGDEWSTAEKLMETMISGGFQEEKIKIEPTRVNLTFKTLDEIVHMLSGSVTETARQGWTEEEKANKWPESIKQALTDEEKETLTLSCMGTWTAFATK